jgi:hypothetical protein
MQSAGRNGRIAMAAIAKVLSRIKVRDVEELKGAAPTLGPGLHPGAPGMPPQMRARGGHVMSEHVPEDISEYKPAKMRKAQGGKIKAGSASGVSRLEAFEMQKRGG